LSRPVELINAANAEIKRRIDWIHIPTLDRSDDAFYAPLATLNTKGARIYLGAVHNMATLKDRVAAARKHLPDFGLAAYCGFGRTPPGDMPKVLQDHVEAVKIAGLA
jgi:hypothetical protein